MPTRGPGWILRLVAWLLPADLRREYGQSILDDHSRKYSQVREEEGTWAAWRFATLSILDMLMLSWRARVPRVGAVWARLNREPPFFVEVKLAFRLLVKHPVLSAASVLATALAIGTSILYFDVATLFAHPTLPFEDGERVVTIENVDVRTGSTALRSLRDLASWRAKVESVEELGAFAYTRANLVTEGGYVEAVTAIEATPAVFRIAGVPPLLGRPLLEGDTDPGAPEVVVIRESLWETAFGRDPRTVGQVIELAGERRRIVGVMPEAFALPMNHRLWIPFQYDPSDYDWLTGPAVRTIGRLAPGITLREAQTELSLIGERHARESPETHAQLRPRVVSYPKALLGGDALGSWLRTGNAVFILLLFVILGNIGALVFARAVTRESELVVRSALGASRGRIVIQFFVEALVLTASGAVLALAVERWILHRGLELFSVLEEEGVPFWWSVDLTPGTLLYVVGLTVAGAILVGVIPALRVTRGGIQSRLQRRAVGTMDLRSRVLSMGVIVAQIAIAGFLLPVAFWSLGLAARSDSALDLPTHDYLVAEYDYSPPVGRLPHERSRQLTLALEALSGGLVPGDPDIRGVTVVDRLPGTTSNSAKVQVEGGAGDRADFEVRTVKRARVGTDFLSVFSVPILRGRGFDARDDEPNANVLVVNESFVQHVLRGQNAIGRRLRFVGGGGEPGPWQEIVGVVPDLGLNPTQPDREEGVYVPTAAGEISPGFLAVRVTSGSLPAAERKLRMAAVQADPGLLVYGLNVWQDIRGAGQRVVAWASALLALSVGFVVFLSTVVTFALMSLAVSRRTREIGIRKALGASQGSVLRSVFSRGLGTLALGAILGAAVSISSLQVLQSWTGVGGTSNLGGDILLLAVPTVASVTFAACLACAPPALRALRIAPTEAMRADA